MHGRRCDDKRQHHAGTSIYRLQSSQYIQLYKLKPLKAPDVAVLGLCIMTGRPLDPLLYSEHGLRVYITWTLAIYLLNAGGPEIRGFGLLSDRDCPNERWQNESEP